MVQEIKENIQQLGDQGFRELKTWLLLEESARRAQEPAVRAGQQEVIAGLQKDGKLPKPEHAGVEDVKPDATFPDWVSPGTSHALMYPRGAVVGHSGRVWESRLDMNHWEPGASGIDERIWLDITHLTELREAEDVEDTESTEGTEDVEDTEDTEGTEDVETATPFAPSLEVKEGDIVTYEGDHYRVLTSHTTASHWPPNEAHALFEKIEATQ